MSEVQKVRVFDLIQEARNLRERWEYGQHAAVVRCVKGEPALGIILGNMLPQADMVKLVELVMA